MADALTTDGPTAGVPATTDATVGTISPIGEVFRDIARGGIAGILVGIFVAGIGGRLVMRLATILHEDTVGRFTENGELIGRISFNGTMALITFGGLGMGLMAGLIWVIVRPWIPGRGLVRALVTGLLAIALGTPALVQGGNTDFIVLDYDPRVVAMLIGLVFAVGFSIALVDGWLDGRLPRAVRAVRISTTVYLIVTLLGLILILPLVVAILLDQPDYRATIRAGWALLAVGLATLGWWVLRVRGATMPPRWLAIAARASLVAAAILGVVTSLPHIRAAIGMPL
jgi:hypothetical protein